MAGPPTQRSLIDRLRDPADQEAWRRFEDTYGDLIVSYCRSRGLQTADAEDVRQVTLVKLVSSLREFTYSRERGRFRDYLFKVIRSAIATHMGARESSGPLGPAADAIDDASAGAWQQEWEQFHFRRAWVWVQTQVEPRTLDAFSRLLRGVSLDQVARELAMTEPALHKIKQRVRDRLRRRIEEQVAEEDGPDAEAARVILGPVRDGGGG